MGKNHFPLSNVSFLTCEMGLIRALNLGIVGGLSDSTS